MQQTLPECASLLIYWQRAWWGWARYLAVFCSRICIEDGLADAHSMAGSSRCMKSCSHRPHAACTLSCVQLQPALPTTTSLAALHLPPNNPTHRQLAQSKSMPRQPAAPAEQQQQQQQQRAAPGASALQGFPKYSSTEDFSSKVEIYRGRHSVVWNVACKVTKKPLILKGYMKVRGSRIGWEGRGGKGCMCVGLCALVCVHWTRPHGPCVYPCARGTCTPYMHAVHARRTCTGACTHNFV